MGFSTAARRPYVRRSFRKNRCAICGVVVCLWVIFYQTMVQSTRLYKFIPVDFGVSARYQEWLASGNLEMPTKAIRERVGQEGVDFDDHYSFLKSLGAGHQGATDLYIDNLASRLVVVKTYNSISLNPLPSVILGRYQDRVHYWPAEIPAMQFVGGGLEDPVALKTTPKGADDGNPGFLQLIDYFITAGPTRKFWKWHLVTPYMEEGTLVNLSRQLTSFNKLPSEVDYLLRPTFIRFLRSLRDLHNEGFCHNDIKPSNIFIHGARSDQAYTDLLKTSKDISLPRLWILGDFGSVREINHRYHETAGFRMENQWNDCRANDARRALKSYLWLLRQASSGHEFDDKFYLMQESWSELYWDFISIPGGVSDLLAMMKTIKNDTIVGHASSSDSRDWGLHNGLTKNSKALSIAITRELRCTTQKTSWTEWWTLGGLLPKAKVESNPFIS